MVELISESEVEYFLYNISKKLSENFYAGIICDKDGFIISSRIPKINNHAIKENELALLAIAEKKIKFQDPNYIAITRDLDSEKTIKLMLLLKKINTNKLFNRYKKLDKLISLQTLF
ncbi:MAG: hypothetical protein ACFFAS_10510 [Promethearchaeota archaeon]